MKANKHELYSPCNVLSLQNLIPARFPSWCIVIDDNVVVLDGKVYYES